MSLAIELLKSEELGGDLALFSGNTFMQTRFWGELKREFGFTPYYFKLTVNGETDGVLLYLRPLFSGFSLAYIPHGPNIKYSEESMLNSLSRELKNFLPGKCLFIRYDLLTGTEGEEFPKPLKGNLRKSSTSIQVPDTTILNIDIPEDDILKGMHKKTRYNIKLASRKGVEVREAREDEINTWYNIYKVTAKRDSIAIHSLEYYQSVYRRAKESEGADIKLLFAEHEGDILAGIFVLISGKCATYLYGASTNNKRNLMPAYLLQWEAIKMSKKLGSESYDFFGIPPVNDKNHPMYGLYRFKTGFGGKIIHRHGCYDFPLSKLYTPLRIIEGIRTFYYKRIKK